MPMMTEKRNLLVERTLDPDAPPAPDIGIAIGFHPKMASPAAFHFGKPVVLYGTYNGDGALLQACKYHLANAIYLAVMRLDKHSVETIRLVTPMMDYQSPDETSSPHYDKDYREGGGFKVDLKRFLELPDEPREYTVTATLGSYKSATLRFSVRD